MSHIIPNKELDRNLENDFWKLDSPEFQDLFNEHRRYQSVKKLAYHFPQLKGNHIRFFDLVLKYSIFKAISSLSASKIMEELLINSKATYDAYRVRLLKTNILQFNEYKRTKFEGGGTERNFITCFTFDRWITQLLLVNNLDLAEKHLNHWKNIFQEQPEIFLPCAENKLNYLTTMLKKKRMVIKYPTRAVPKAKTAKNLWYPDLKEYTKNGGNYKKSGMSGKSPKSGMSVTTGGSNIFIKNYDIKKKELRKPPDFDKIVAAASLAVQKVVKDHDLEIRLRKLSQEKFKLCLEYLEFNLHKIPKIKNLAGYLARGIEGEDHYVIEDVQKWRDEQFYKNNELNLINNNKKLAIDYINNNKSETITLHKTDYGLQYIIKYPGDISRANCIGYKSEDFQERMERILRAG